MITLAQIRERLIQEIKVSGMTYTDIANKLTFLGHLFRTLLEEIFYLH